jgi:hypothetical protein
MWSKLFTEAPLLVLPICSMLLFLAVFAGAVLWAWRRGGRDCNAVARLPLERDDATAPPEGSR